MNIKTLVCLVPTFALASGAFAQVPSLAALAKAEKARRARIHANGMTAKVYTEGDRSGNAGQTTAAAAGDNPSADAAVPAAPGAANKKEKTPEEIAAEKQKEWGEKVQAAQDQIKALEAAISTNERALASTFNITPARADLANRIEADKKHVAELKQSLVSLEDERRRAGMPRSR